MIYQNDSENLIKVDFRPKSYIFKFLEFINWRAFEFFLLLKKILFTVKFVFFLIIIGGI